MNKFNERRFDDIVAFVPIVPELLVKLQISISYTLFLPFILFRNENWMIFSVDLHHTVMSNMEYVQDGRIGA